MINPIVKLAVFGVLLVGVVILLVHLMPYAIGILAVFGLYKLWQALGGGRPPTAPPFFGRGH